MNWPGFEAGGRDDEERRTTMTLARVRVCVAVMWAAVAIGGLGVARAATVALWLFDDDGGEAMERVPGKFGRAFRPAAQAALGGATEHAGAPSRANPTDSRLNLGASDWTIECWLRLDADAGDEGNEGTILEIGTGPRGTSELATRFSVLPRENAFALACVESEAHGIAKRVGFPNPAGPPGGVAWLRTVTLALSGAPMPRGAWFHVALVHLAASGELRLFLDGRRCAAAVTKVTALPRGAESYLSIGRDGAAGRRLRGALDELRVSDEAVYAGDFSPPGSFSPVLPSAARGTP